MDEIRFRKWLSESGKNKKVVSDTVSRIRKTEHELNNLSVDEEYEKDQCSKLLSLFENTGRNDTMLKYNTSLPIGKYSLSTYKYAVKLYIMFLEDNN